MAVPALFALLFEVLPLCVLLHYNRRPPVLVRVSSAGPLCDLPPLHRITVQASLDTRAGRYGSSDMSAGGQGSSPLRLLALQWASSSNNSISSRARSPASAALGGERSPLLERDKPRAAPATTPAVPVKTWGNALLANLQAVLKRGGPRKSAAASILGPRGVPGVANPRSARIGAPSTAPAASSLGPPADGAFGAAERSVGAASPGLGGSIAILISSQPSLLPYQPPCRNDSPGINCSDAPAVLGQSLGNISGSGSGESLTTDLLASRRLAAQQPLHSPLAS